MNTAEKQAHLPKSLNLCVVFSSQIFYKDDLNYLRGIGCFAWDTPEILRVKHAGDLQSEVSVPRIYSFLCCSSVSHPRQLLGLNLPVNLVFNVRWCWSLCLCFFIPEQVQSQRYRGFQGVLSGDGHSGLRDGQAELSEPERCKSCSQQCSLIVFILWRYKNEWSHLFLLFFQLHYRYDYNVNIKGTNTAPPVTVDTERARLANYIQSDVR